MRNQQHTEKIKPILTTPRNTLENLNYLYKMNEDRNNQFCLNLDKELFDKVLAGEVKVIHKEASDYWNRILLKGKGLTAKSILIENGRQKSRKSFMVEYKSIDVVTLNGNQFFALTLGKIILDYSGKRKKKPVKKVITKPVHGQKINLKVYSGQVHKCITDIRGDINKLKLTGVGQKEADIQKLIIIEKYSNQYNLNYTNINQIYYGNFKA